MAIGYCVLAKISENDDHCDDGNDEIGNGYLEIQNCYNDAYNNYSFMKMCYFIQHAR